MGDSLKPTNVELDPLFSKAIKLMQSNRPNAAVELFEMYETTCRQKRGESKIDSDDTGKFMKIIPNGEFLDVKKNTCEKILKEKAKNNSKETCSAPASEPESSSNDEDEMPVRTNSNIERVTIIKRKLSSDSDTEVSDMDATENDDLSIDLDISSLSCIICKTLSQTNTNKLVECQECHNLFHQECHKPPITENVNDPRFVWYCVKCSKNMKKIANKVVIKKQKISTSPVSGVSNCSGNSNQNPPTPFTKAATIEMMQNAASLSCHSLALVQQPFKRLDLPVKGPDQLKNASKSGKSAYERHSMKDSGSAGALRSFEGKANNALQKPTLKNSPSFTSAIGASLSGSSLTFSDSLARISNDSSKKTLVVKSGEKK